MGWLISDQVSRGVRVCGLEVALEPRGCAWAIPRARTPGALTPGAWAIPRAPPGSARAAAAQAGKSVVKSGRALLN